MRQLLLSLVMLCLPVLSAQAQEARNPAIETVIQQQFAAFRAEDVGTAFSFASPNIKGMFGTPENFGRMVRDGYPMVWRPAEVQFLDLRRVAGNLWQRVMVTDQAGRTHLLDYQMVETGQGWQINGVQILPQAAVGA